MQFCLHLETYHSNLVISGTETWGIYLQCPFVHESVFFFFISHTFNSVDWFLTDYTIEVYSMCNETATKGFHFHIKNHMCGQSTIIYDYTVHAFLETLPQYTNQLMRLLSIYMLLRYYVKGKRFKMDKPFGFSVGNFSIVLKQYNILFSLRYC